jgi:hypothetical protein
MSRTAVLDVLERVAFTYLESLFGLWLASGLGIAVVTDLAVYQKALVSCLPALLALIKSLIALRAAGTLSPASLAEGPAAPAAGDGRGRTLP